MKKNILHVIDSLTLGGAEILLRNTINNLPDYNHVVVYLSKPDALKNSFNPGVKFHYLNYKGPKSLIVSIFKLRKIINELNPWIIHSHLQFSNLISRFSTPKRIPLVTSLHSIYSLDAFEKNKKSLWLEKLSIRSYQSIVAISNEVLRDYLKLVPFKGKKFVLYNFIPDQFFEIRHVKNNETQRLKCIAVGNLKKLKNFHYLIRAFKELKEENISLDIYGSGELESELNEEIKINSLPVKLCGVKEDLHLILPHYDLFIQASLHEGYSLTVMEAMAIGLPLLISDIPVFHEVTENFAHFFSLADTDSFIEKIKELKNKNDLRYKFYYHSLKIAENNASKKKYIEKLTSIYQCLGDKN